MELMAFWRRVDIQGHDACRLSHRNSKWVLNGAAVYLENQTITSVNYQVVCDPGWTTKSAVISGWSGQKELNIEIARETNGRWRCNGVDIDPVFGSLDVDLGFTPATNTCAIRRLNLDVHQKEETTAAWLDTSDWTLKPLEQYYCRRSQTTYEYGSPAHGFQAQLTTDRFGLVKEYPGYWASDE